MTTHFTELAQRAAADGVVSPEELLGLRRQGWGDGIITREEAEALFAINNVLDDRDNEWCDFFVEAIGEYVLNGTQPRLQCNKAEAEWLIQQVDHDGVVESVVELETLVRIVERAENVPDPLKNYILEQVEREVMSGTGPTRCGGELSATHITGAEVRILRRVIFSSGGYGPAAVTRFDAELLFRLKDATLEDENDAGWADLFVDAIANYIRGFALDNAQLSHARKLELMKFVENNTANHAAFFGRMIRQTPNIGSNVSEAFKHLRGEDGPQNDYSADFEAGDIVTENERSWLESQLKKDGQIDAIEARLIERIAEED
ncbi:hypothetical protein [Erythrobacter crassostreae]|uniref:Uncharacterized protein n=1 Tax=Erythrobacter crassostreae TaxID=2828328 RepID=A0A9X1F1J8_9SPHN|nr:hypothetical protein [Erythrobacter crassostrea]MBV7258627.1 hypothetical protein [Erythrobacter crassostrea]